MVNLFLHSVLKIDKYNQFCFLLQIGSSTVGFVYWYQNIDQFYHCNHTSLNLHFSHLSSEVCSKLQLLQSLKNKFNIFDV